MKLNGPSRQQVGNLRPLVAPAALRINNNLLLLRRPRPLTDAGVKMVVPSEDGKQQSAEVCLFGGCIDEWR